MMSYEAATVIMESERGDARPREVSDKTIRKPRLINESIN